MAKAPKKVPSPTKNAPIKKNPPKKPLKGNGGIDKYIPQSEKVEYDIGSK